MNFFKKLIKGWRSTTSRQKRGVGIALGISFLHLLIMRYMFLPCFIPTLNSWESYKINIPDWQGRITFYRKPIHPFLAEYERKLKVKFSNGKTIKSPLNVNTGGRTYIEVFRIEPKSNEQAMLLFRDHHGEYLIDSLNCKILRVIKIDKYNRVFAGEITDSWEGYSTYISENEISVEICNKSAEDITHYNLYERIKYIGCIDGKDSLPHFISYEKPKLIDYKTILYD